MNTHFGKWLDEQIAGRGDTKVAFAAKIGVSEPALRSWCSGRQTAIRTYNLARIASALGITLDEIRSHLFPTQNDSPETDTSKPDVHTPPRRSRNNGVSSPPQHVSRIAAAGA